MPRIEELGSVSMPPALARDFEGREARKPDGPALQQREAADRMEALLAGS